MVESLGWLAVGLNELVPSHNSSIVSIRFVML